MGPVRLVGADAFGGDNEIECEAELGRGGLRDASSMLLSAPTFARLCKAMRPSWLSGRLATFFGLSAKASRVCASGSTPCSAQIWSKQRRSTSG